MAKILVIDNDPDIVEAIKIILASKNHEVIISSSGDEGLEKAKEIKPDAIILDVMMETIDKGFEVCRILKNDEETKNIPIMLLTAIKELPDMDFSLGGTGSTGQEADYFCEKPIDSDELLDKINKLLSK